MSYMKTDAVRAASRNDLNNAIELTLEGVQDVAVLRIEMAAALEGAVHVDHDRVADVGVSVDRAYSALLAANRWRHLLELDEMAQLEASWALHTRSHDEWVDLRIAHAKRDT